MTALAKLLGVLSKFSLAIEPPSEDLDLNTEAGRRMMRWRTNIAGFITLLCYAFLVSVTWSIGFVPYFGGGFARAQEVRDVKAELVARKIEEIETVLCMEQPSQQLMEYRRRLRDEYRELTGREPDVPPCEVLLKLKR